MLSDKGATKMTVDTNPFLKLNINMVSYEYPTTKKKGETGMATKDLWEIGN